MNQKDRDILTGILQDFLIERKHLEDKIQNNLESIQLIEDHIKSLIEKEDIDYRVFSPRKIESEFQSEKDKSNEEKEIYENENKECYKKLNKLNGYISRLEELDHVEEDVNACNLEQRDKSLTILNIQEEERQRIARDLHDTSLQNLAHLVHKIELSSLFIDPDPIRAKLELAVVTKNLKAVIEEIRNTIFDLRPMCFDDLGWKDTLERLLDKLNENKELDITAEIEDINCGNNLILVTVYRVIKEVISNAFKHSGGDKLFFSCKRQGCDCVIVIRDNGKGFTMKEVEDKKDKHFGLSVIQERIDLMGGKMDIISEAGIGTQFDIRVPLQ